MGCRCARTDANPLQPRPRSLEGAGGAPTPGWGLSLTPGDCANITFSVSPESGLGRVFCTKGPGMFSEWPVAPGFGLGVPVPLPRGGVMSGSRSRRGMEGGMRRKLLERQRESLEVQSEPSQPRSLSAGPASTERGTRAAVRALGPCHCPDSGLSQGEPMAPSSVSHHPPPPLPVWWEEPPPPCPRPKINPDSPPLSTPTLLRAREGWMKDFCEGDKTSPGT